MHLSLSGHFDTYFALVGNLLLETVILNSDLVFGKGRLWLFPTRTRRCTENGYIAKMESLPFGIRGSLLAEKFKRHLESIDRNMLFGNDVTKIHNGAIYRVTFSSY